MIVHQLARRVISNQLKTMSCKSFQIIRFESLISKSISFFGNHSKRPSEKDRTIANSTLLKRQNEIDGLIKDSQEEISQNNQENKKAINQPNHQVKKIFQFAFFFRLTEKEQVELVNQYFQQGKIRELSKICKQMANQGVTSDALWSMMEKIFIDCLQPPYDAIKVKRISFFFDGLVKAKRFSRNYQKDLIQVLPYASIQSYTDIVRLAKKSFGTKHDQMFVETVEKLYKQMRDLFSPTQALIINYSLAKFGRKVDISIAQNVENFNLQSLCILLNAFDISKCMTNEVLKKCAQALVARKEPMTFFEIGNMCRIYFKYQFFDNVRFLLYLAQQFNNMRDRDKIFGFKFFSNIWPYFPEAINKNRLPPSLGEGIIDRLIASKKNSEFKPEQWKFFQRSFNKFQNQEIKKKLQDA